MMKQYDAQINKLACAVRARQVALLHVYDIDGTLAPYHGDKRYTAPIRRPCAPYILLSSRVTAYLEMTREWCGMYGLKPLAIFHRIPELWSFEKQNLDCFKPVILLRISRAMPEVQLDVFDDEKFDTDNIFKYNLESVHFNKVPRVEYV